MYAEIKERSVQSRERRTKQLAEPVDAFLYTKETRSGVVLCFTRRVNIFRILTAFVRSTAVSLSSGLLVQSILPVPTIFLNSRVRVP